MKPAESEVGGPDFSYQGAYDSYASALGAAAGMEVYDAVYGSGYGIGDVLLISPQRKDKAEKAAENLSTASKQMNITELVDPALLDYDSNNPTKISVSRDFDANPTLDTSRFLTQHARPLTTLMSVPMIYGVPSSTGLSLNDLERTVRESLSAVKS